MPQYHIAQINIARMLASITDPIMAEFMTQLPPINALADQSPGFVWRLQSESGDATSIKVYDDDFVIVNLTVWESVDALREYVYKSAHQGVCAIVNAGLRNLMVHIMLCGGFQLAIIPAQKKARKGWITCANMEIRLLRSHLRMFSRTLQINGIGKEFIRDRKQRVISEQRYNRHCWKLNSDAENADLILLNQ